MAKLSKRVLDALKPESRDQALWDDALPGFGVRVKPTGVVSFVVQYRNRDGQSRRMTIGRYGVLTADEARKRAREVLADVQRGQDPVAAKKSNRAAPNMSDLCDRYLSDHVAIHNRPNTQRECSRLVEKLIRPALGGLKVANVTRQDVIKLHLSMKATPRRANMMLSVLSKMFNLAELWEWRDEGRNPARRIQRYPEVARSRFFSDEEMQRLGAALIELEREGKITAIAATAITLLALSGCRLGEILTLAWSFIDFERRMLHLPTSKTGAKVVVLGDLAISLLASIPRQGGSPYVFNGTVPGAPIGHNAIEKAWAKVRARAELADARLHDLRHTVGTYAGQSGANAFLIRDKLGHKTLAMTGRYVSADPAPLRDLTGAVEDRIGSALGLDGALALVASSKSRFPVSR